MKILVLNNQSGLLGGSEAVFHDTTEMLRENGHEVLTVTAYGPRKDVPKYDYCFGKSGARRLLMSIVDPGISRKLRSLISDFAPDVMHAHIFHGGLTYSIVNEMMKSGVPLVLTIHEYKLLCPVFTMLNGKNEVCDECSDGSYYRAVVNKCKKNSLAWSAHSALDSYVRKIFYHDLNQFDRYIFVSKFARDLHLRYRPELRARSVQIYNPIPADFGRHANPASDRCGFLYVGRLSHEKGLELLITAASKNQEVRLDIVGDGPLRGKLEALIENYGAADRIRLLGFLDRSEIPAIMQAHKFLLIPSEWYENNPMSLLESLANGLPAIGSRIGGIPELVQDGLTGKLFEPFSFDSLSDSLAWGLQIADDDWNELSRNSRKFVTSQMGRERYFKELMGLYDELILESKVI